MVIDGDSAYRELTQLLCAHILPKHEVVCALGPVDLARRLSQDRYALTVVDPTVEWAAGEDLLALLLDQGRPQSVLVFTEKDSAQAAVNALRRGALDYIIKSPRGVLDLNQALVDVSSVDGRIDIRPVADSGETHALSAIRHDMTEPLRSILTCLDLIRTHQAEDLDETVRMLLNTAEVTAREVLERIESQLAQLAGEMPISSLTDITGAAPDVSCDANEAVDLALKTLTSLIKTTGGSVTRNTLPLVLMDAKDLHLVFQILISNGLKYAGRPDPEVTIDAQSSSDGMVQFRVSDNGPGIPEEERLEIFKPFFRGAASKGLSGSGIGLNTCQDTLQRAGGRIWVDPDADTGAAFIFEVPSAKVV